MKRQRKRPETDGRIEVLVARRSQRRAKTMFWGALVLACFLAWRLYQIQVVQGPGLAAMALRQQSATIPMNALRGPIYTSDGVLLARSLPSRSIYVHPQDVGDVAKAARTLSPVMHLSIEEIERRIREVRTYHAIAWKVSDDEATAVEHLPLGGVSVEDEASGKRFVPSGRFASTLLGFVGRDDDGLEGIEYEFDGLLKGTNGLKTLETDEFTRALPFANARYIEPPRAGKTIVLTIDSYLQDTAQRVLQQTVQEYGGASGSAIVMDPNDGALLAVANVPNYDVNAYAAYPADERRDRAVTDAYEPGSTFKLITATAALESGKVTTSSRFPARDELEIGGSVIHNAEDGLLANGAGTETLEEIIAKSHNVGAAEVGLTIGRGTMYRQMQAFGFGEKTGVDLPGENPGIVPPVEEWSETSLPTMSFGHGIAITPLALVRAYAAIANGGLLLRPRICSAILDEDGHVIYRYGRQVERRVMSRATSATLRKFLRSVVLWGTGTSARVPGYTTAGKTGTAQVAEGGRYLSGAYVASFVGLIPAEHPRFVILVKVERPRTAIYGGIVAAPAFARLARAAMLEAGVMPSPSQVPAATRLPSVTRSVTSKRSA